LHQRLDEQAVKIATVYATLDSILRDGHPLRRSDDPAPPAADEKEASWLKLNWWKLDLAALAGERILTELPKAIRLIVGGG
jgi:hypothetical protein